jgi:hypothetical protein
LINGLFRFWILLSVFLGLDRLMNQKYKDSKIIKAGFDECLPDVAKCGENSVEVFEKQAHNQQLSRCTRSE